MLLDNARIGTPCDARWEAMAGDERVRFCEGCGKNVYNLSALPRAEAERLLVEREGPLCVRLYERADGTVMTADCPVGLQRLRVRRVMTAAVSLSAMALMATAVAWRRGVLAAAPAALEMMATPDAPAPVAVVESTPPPAPAMDERPDPPQSPPPAPRARHSQPIRPKPAGRSRAIMGDYAF